MPSSAGRWPEARKRQPSTHPLAHQIARTEWTEGHQPDNAPPLTCTDRTQGYWLEPLRATFNPLGQGSTWRPTGTLQAHRSQRSALWPPAIAGSLGWGESAV